MLIQIIGGNQLFMNKNCIIEKAKHIKAYAPVPTYEKLNMMYCLKMMFGCLIGSDHSWESLNYYLKSRKEKNEKYNKFWADVSNVEFNEDKTMYVKMHFNDCTVDLR